MIMIFAKDGYGLVELLSYNSPIVPRVGESVYFNGHTYKVEKVSHEPWVAPLGNGLHVKVYVEKD